MNSKLNWPVHIHSVCNKTKRVNYLLWSLEYLRVAYVGLFPSHILYGLLLWGRSPHINDILLLQKQAVHNSAEVGRSNEHCKPLFVYTIHSKSR